MKKSLLFLIALCCMSVAGRAQTATLMEGYGDPLTLDQFKALAGTDGRFGFVASSNTAAANAPRCDHWCKFTSVHNTTTLDEEALFYLEASGDNYKVKRSSDGMYVNTSASATSFDAEGSEFKLVNRDPNDATKAVVGEQSISFEDPSNATMHYNANAVKYNTGPGAWTTYAVFGPIYIVEIDCQEGGVSMDGYPQTQFVVGGQEVSAPEFVGKKLAGTTSSYTIAQDYTGGSKIVFSYEASLFTYSLTVNGAPDGTTMTIKGNDVSITETSVSYPDEVVAGDVVVTFPSECEFMGAKVSINGAAIIVDCDDTRWPINFSKTQTFTRSDRHINSVTFKLDGENQTVDGIYQNTSTLCYQDLTATKTVRLPAGTAVTPHFNIAGAWQHAFVYIDLNNDGDFTDDGELVSKINENNPGSDFDLPEFTTTTDGTYRMRIKTDWASEDPGGNPGADINDVSSSNHIIANGGMIVDVTLEIFTVSCHVTYVVKDEGGNTLFTSAPLAASLGETVTTLPTEFQKTEFFDYDELNMTINEENATAVFTATAKETPLVPFTADATSPIWVVLKLKDSSYLTYVPDGTPNVTLPAENAGDETTEWAFVGNPYTGFQIMNRAAGTGFVLGSELAGNDDNNGGNTYATLAEAGTQSYETWMLRASSYLTDKGGFFIYNAENQYLNHRSTANLAYWTGGHDSGSTFTIDNTATGIAGVAAGMLQTGDAVYDLSGRRVAAPAKGIYVVKGRKVIMK